MPNPLVASAAFKKQKGMDGLRKKKYYFFFFVLLGKERFVGQLFVPPFCLVHFYFIHFFFLGLWDSSWFGNVATLLR